MKKDITVAICDNEKAELDIETAMVTEWFAAQERVSVTVTQFSETAALKERVAGGDTFDIYILGVILRGSGGIELGRMARTRNPYAPVIYVTRSRNHALDAYSVGALRYILKPVKYGELASALDLACVLLSAAAKSAVAVRSSGTVRSVDADDILYIENNVRSMRYVMRDGSTLDGTRRNISFERYFAPLLASGRFVQTHKSFIINMNYIKVLRASSVLMQNGTSVPISRRHLAEVHSEYERFAFGAKV